jgi:uncharacterized repeat protein (TIGR01451 family)
LGTILAGETRIFSFQATAPSVDPRQATETSIEYQTRLASLDGRLFTASGEVTFSDADGQLFLPVPISSSSALALPILTAAISGPSIATPGSTISYRVTVTNIGSAEAPSATATIVLPGGGAETVAITDLAAGAGFSTTVQHVVDPVPPRDPAESSQDYLARLQAADGDLLETSVEVSWQDALGNSYGEIERSMFTIEQRLPILSVTPEVPSTLLPNQTVDVEWTLENIGGCTAVQANLTAENPDGTMPEAGPADLAAGDSTILTTVFTVPTVEGFEPEETGEAAAEYLARLIATSTTTLDFDGELVWSDPSATPYGPTNTPAQSTEVLPIVSLVIDGPAEADSGDTVTYTVNLINIGDAQAERIMLTVSFPDGSVQTPAVGPLAAGTSVSVPVQFTIPSNQPTGEITVLSEVLWHDAINNFYGPLPSSIVTPVTKPAPPQQNLLSLAPPVTGAVVTGTVQSLTATLVTAGGTPVPDSSVDFTVTGANPTTGSATTDAAGVATFPRSRRFPLPPSSRASLARTVPAPSPPRPTGSLCGPRPSRRSTLIRPVERCPETHRVSA